MERLIQSYITRSSIVLQPHRALVGQAATVFSILQMLSPIFMFNNMRKSKSTLGMPFLPFLVGAVLTSLNVRFSQMLNDDATFQANSVGFSIMVVYISLYVYFASPREKSACFMKVLGAAAFIGLAIAYSKVENPDKVEHRFGLLLTSIMYCFFVLPIMGIYQTLTEKCTRHLPLPMILSGSLVGFCWLLHGVIINSGFVIVQNLFMLGINLIQLSLFLIYPSEPVSTTTKKGKTKPKKKRE